MAIKLGEMLVKGGAITLDQLEEALKYQVIFGGKLGTNLIELGYLEEEGIAWFLSEKLGLPYVHPDKLMNIPPSVIKLIPRELVSKFKVIPISLDKKRLTLAMADPADLAAIDEIAFITGLTIKPVVAPEVRIVLALEKYYKIDRDVRYIPIMENREKKKEAAPPPPEEESAAPEAETPAKEPQEVPPPPEAVPEEKVKRSPEQAPAAEEEAAPEGEEELEEADIVEEETRREILESFSIDEVSKNLANAKDREAIANIVIKYAGHDFKNVALFIIRSKSAVAWRALKEQHFIEPVSHFQISFQGPSAIRTVAEGKSFYLGPLADNAGNRVLVDIFGGVLPSAALFIPIILMGKLVSVLYLEDSRADLGAKVIELQRLAHKISMAFEILIIKNKIMMT